MPVEVIKNMPFADYCRLDGINASALKGDGRHSPKHLDAYLSGRMGHTDSEEKKFGRAVHCMILEPDRFEAEFPVSTQCGG